MAVDLRASTVLPVAPERVFAEVADLATYPHWLGVVQGAEPAGEGLAWVVDLGARLGPLRKAKRVRMVRVACDPVDHVRFERDEADGREHSPWVLRADLVPAPEGTELTMYLHYGGGAWLPGLDLVLGQEVRRAGARLAARLA